MKLKRKGAMDLKIKEERPGRNTGGVALLATMRQLHKLLFYRDHGSEWVVTQHNQTSDVTSNTSHVTRHTSHVTRHTSHVTRHTSHVTFVGKAQTISSPCPSTPPQPSPQDKTCATNARECPARHRPTGTSESKDKNRWKKKTQQPKASRRASTSIVSVKASV